MSTDKSKVNSSFSFLIKYSESTGTTAALAAPSPTRSRNRLGILKATKNASAFSPVPSNLASTTSLKKPKIRDVKVPQDRIDVDFMRELRECFPLCSLRGLEEFTFDLSVDMHRPF